MKWLPTYGTTEGPLGFPMSDRQARMLDHVLKSLPKTDDYAYRKAVVAQAPTELNPGERSDVSWISTESPDRDREVVIARGMNASQFLANPVVTMQHAYWCPPVGKSLWQKRVKDGDQVGIKAKTKYPEKPKDWPEGGKDGADAWPPDNAFLLVQAGLLNGKSIGFLPVKMHIPDDNEYAARNWKPSEVKRVIDDWILLEYACVFLGANQDALVEDVSKALGGDVPEVILEQLDIAGKGVVAYTATAIAPADHPWDGDAARGRLWDWSGGKLKKYQRGFAYVTGDGQHKEDYKLPHHDIVDGKLAVIWKGVVAAYAAAGGARADMGLSEADVKAVKAHLGKHYRQFGKEPPDGDGKAKILAHTTLEDLHKAITNRIHGIDLEKMADKLWQEAWDRARGKI